MTALAKRILALVVAAAASLAHADKLPNGDFETVEDGRAAGWGLKGNATLAEENGNHFLRITADENKIVNVYRVIKVDPVDKAYTLTMKVRYDDVQKGKAIWHDARVILDFKNDENEKVGSGGAPNWKGTTKGEWKDVSVSFLVPEGATKLEMLPGLYAVKSGTFDLDDLALTPTDPQPILDKKAADAAKAAEERARRAAAVKPQVEAVPADKLPKELRVVGNKIVNADGQEVWLQGVSLASLEWSAAGDNILKSVTVACTEWKANVLRMPVREHFWNGTGPYQRDGGAAYRQLVDDSINLAAAHGAYMVIDLHRYRAPEQQHLDFWKQIAEKYKNHPSVLFELLNEPHDISWDVWKNGGVVTDEKSSKNVIAENGEKLRGFQSVGMQAMLDAIRESGAKNIVIAGGLDWGYDLSGVLSGYALDDRGGNGIVYSTHVYPWKSDWQNKFLALADKYPLFIGELGGEDKPMPFLRPDQHEDPHTWAPDMLGLIQKHKFHWTGWCFHPKSSPRLLLDWDYTPTPFWGVYVKDALAGKQFEVKKLR
jgi:endoglucanase